MDKYGYDELQRDALGFILESEMWPVFLQWVRNNVISDVGRQWLETAPPELHKWRVEWMHHSPDPQLRAVAEMGPHEAV